jgi:hypothetical protein
VSESRSSLRWLLTFSNDGRSSATGLTSSQAGDHLTRISYTSSCRLKTLVMAAGPRYIASARTAQKTPLPTVTPLLRVTQPLSSNDCLSGSTVLAFNATVLTSYNLKKWEKYYK